MKDDETMRIAGVEIDMEGGAYLDDIYEGFKAEGIPISYSSKCVTLVANDDSGHVAVVLVMSDEDDNPTTVAIFEPDDLRKHAMALLAALEGTSHTH